MALMSELVDSRLYTKKKTCESLWCGIFGMCSQAYEACMCGAHYPSKLLLFLFLHTVATVDSTVGSPSGTHPIDLNAGSGGSIHLR